MSVLPIAGNPNSGKFADFEPVLTRARSVHGLRVTAHVGELADHADTAATVQFEPFWTWSTVSGCWPGWRGYLIVDTRLVLQIAFGPDRYGHAIIMTPQLLSSLSTARVGGNGTGTGGRRAAIEICPTSNLRTLELGDDITRHPTLRYWLDRVNDRVGREVAAAQLAAGPRIAICTDDTALFAIRVIPPAAL